jgi:hypothetical protein
LQNSELLPWFITAIVIGGVITGSINSMIRGKIERTFRSLGMITGKQKQEIIDVVGPPTSVSIVGSDLTLLQWETKYYNIVLRFNGDICEGVATDVPRFG